MSAETIRLTMSQALVRYLIAQQTVLDGATATRLLKAERATAAIPIIAMSAAARLRADAADLPADGTLEKPFDLDDLLGVVGGYLSDAAGTPGSFGSGARA